MKNLFSIKTVAKLVGVRKKEIKGILLDKGIITYSLAIRNGGGYVAEICVYHDDHVETSLRLTTAGVIMLIEEVYHG